MNCASSKALLHIHCSWYLKPVFFLVQAEMLMIGAWALGRPCTTLSLWRGVSMGDAHTAQGDSEFDGEAVVQMNFVAMINYS